jgi:hypothetical protein
MDENRVVVVVAEERGGDHHAHTHVPIVATFGSNYEQLRARAQEDAIAEKCSEVKRRDRDREK